MFYKKSCSKNFRNTYSETPVLESLINLPILSNIYKQLLLYRHDPHSSSARFITRFVDKNEIGINEFIRYTKEVLPPVMSSPKWIYLWSKYVKSHLWNKLLHMWYVRRFCSICTILKNVKNTHGVVLLLVLY